MSGLWESGSFKVRELNFTVPKCHLKRPSPPKSHVNCEVKNKRPRSEHNRPKFGSTSVCGRRKEMEDAVSIHPSFSGPDCHFYGVYDGHGCSHVAMKCMDRMHEIVRDEMGGCHDSESWKLTMEGSFERMDREVHDCCSAQAKDSDCRCKLKTPQCDTVGSTAVVAVVMPQKIVVSNCGDSRAVLCLNGLAVPVNVGVCMDGQPDRPDELCRIELAGGRVIYWDGPRVLGVLAMSRAIGDDYLKPFVIPTPEVTITDRTAEDEFLILASDGLWDVVDNETACGIVRTCLLDQSSISEGVKERSDKACLAASVLLTKMALARLSLDNVSVVVVDLRRNL